eukprot:m51a1_g6841 hypothetical protein (449) ;mRNA; r:72623-76115
MASTGDANSPGTECCILYSLVMDTSPPSSSPSTTSRPSSPSSSPSASTPPPSSVPSLLSTQSDCETENKDELATCYALLRDCKTSSSGSSEVFLRKRDDTTAEGGESDDCGCFYEFVRCFKGICPHSKLPDIAEKAGVREDECKDKSPDCYYSIWGDPHFVVAAAGAQRKPMFGGGWSQPGERHFTCGMTAFKNLYTSASMVVAADADPWPFVPQQVTTLRSVTVTLRPSGKVYTTSKEAFGFDTSVGAPAGVVIWGYCDVPLSTVQKGCDASDDDRDDNVIGGDDMGRRSLSNVATASADTRALARAACSAVGGGFVAACEFDVRTTGEPKFAQQAARASTRLNSAAEFLETYAAVPSAAAAGAATAASAIAAGVAGGVVGAVAIAGGVGAAVYIVKKKSASTPDGPKECPVDVCVTQTQPHRGVNVMNPKPGMHQSITGRAPPVAV